MDMSSCQVRHQLDRPKLIGTNVSHRSQSMSVAFLECKAFKEFLPFGYECCENCHKFKRNLIFIRPYKPGEENPDWMLCIEGIVCCKVYDYVREVPHGWWERMAKDLGVNREDMRGYIYPGSPQRNTERPASPKTIIPRSTAAARRRAALQRDEPSLDDFLKRRR